MISMTAMLMAMAITVPSGPAMGRKVDPGIAQTSRGDRYLSYILLAL